MDKVVSIFNGLSEFIELFKIKYEYENRGLLKKMKIDSRLNLELNDNTWSKFFLYKSCYNHCAKFILLKILEDRGYISPKINRQGLEKWKGFAKNIATDYSTLYSLAIRDLQFDSDNKIRNSFKSSDYDIFIIDNELAYVLIDYFVSYDFLELSESGIDKIFQLIYPLEQREEFDLENFYRKAPAFDIILKGLLF